MNRLDLISNNKILMSPGCIQRCRRQCPGCLSIIWGEGEKSYVGRISCTRTCHLMYKTGSNRLRALNLEQSDLLGSPRPCRASQQRGGQRDTAGGLSPGEDQEAREDAVRAFDPHEGVLLCRLQPDRLIHCHLEDHATGGDLVAALHVVTEGHHLLGPGSTLALFHTEAQVGPGGDMVGEVVDARDLADEAAIPVLIVALLIGDDAIKADGLVPAWVGADGPCSREGGLESGLIVTRVPWRARGSHDTWWPPETWGSPGANLPRVPWHSWVSVLPYVFFMLHLTRGT